MTERRLTMEQSLLALVIIGFAGVLAELLLLEHFEDLPQYIPLVLLLAGLGAVWWRAASKTETSARALAWTMLVVIASGALGIVLHLKGNVEFEHEMNPSLSGWPLIVEVLTGATPALAPGTMTLLGLLGLVYLKSTR